MRSDNVAGRIDETHVEGNDVALSEEVGLAVGDGEAFLARTLARGLAGPHQDVHAEGAAIAGDDMGNAAPTVETVRLAAQCRANTDLPAPGLERRHLLGNLANGSQNEPPRQLGRGIGWCTRVRVRRYDDAKTRAGIDVNMRP